MIIGTSEKGEVEDTGKRWKETRNAIQRKLLNTLGETDQPRD